MFFRIYGGVFGLDTSFFPNVTLVAGLDLEQDFDVELAKKVAENFNKDTIGLSIEINDNREMGIACFSIAVTCHALKEILPYMAAYLEQGRLHFIRLYNEAVKEDASKKTAPNSKKIVS